MKGLRSEAAARPSALHVGGRRVAYALSSSKLTTESLLLLFGPDCAGWKYTFGAVDRLI